MKGTWDTSGMAVACREGAGCVETCQDASKGAAVRA